MAKVGRPKSMTGAEVLECIFQDPDSGDSDIDDGGDGGDDAADSPIGSDDDAMSDVEPDERDADASKADTEDTERSDDIDAGPPRMKVPRVDDSWTWNRCSKKRRIQPRPLSVMKEEQILVDMPDDASPYDFFKLYVTDELLDMIVIETNRYAAQYIADNLGSLKPHSLVHKWKVTDRDEITVVLGLMLHMGLVYKPRLSTYWSTNELLEIYTETK